MGGAKVSLENFSINDIVQFIGLSENWGSELPYIANSRAPETTRGWGSTGSTDYTGWGITGSTNSTFKWGGSVNASPANSLRIPVFPSFSKPCP